MFFFQYNKTTGFLLHKRDNGSNRPSYRDDPRQPLTSPAVLDHGYCRVRKPWIGKMITKYRHTSEHAVCLRSTKYSHTFVVSILERGLLNVQCDSVVQSTVIYL